MNILELLSDWQNRLALYSAFGPIEERADAVRTDIRREIERMHLTANANKPEQEDNVQLALSYAKDVVDFWPNFSIRQIPAMAAKIKALKEALEMVK